MKQFSFERLEVYNKSRRLITEVYKLIENFPKEEKYVLCDQIRRCIISVPSNIAEQSGRTSLKEKLHFIEISYGSLMKAYCQLQIAVDLNYITEKQLSTLKEKFIEISMLLTGLRKYLKNKLQNNIIP